MENIDYDYLSIDWEYDSVVREFNDPERLGYVIASIPYGYHSYAEKHLQAISDAYDISTRYVNGIKYPLSKDDLIELLIPLIQ